MVGSVPCSGSFIAAGSGSPSAVEFLDEFGFARKHRTLAPPSSPPSMFTSSLTASALCAMAILQVYQVKVLRDPQKGGLKPEMMQELRSVTDYALQATKVTEGHRLQALGWAMSTLVVQEHNLLLNLMEIRDAEKVHLFRDTVEVFAQPLLAVKKQMEPIKPILPPSPAAQPSPGLAARPAHRFSRRMVAPPTSQQATKNHQKTSTHTGNPGKEERLLTCSIGVEP
ncbi:hypothetical protein PO909_006557 [Leuciscus waleckii]